MSKKTLLSPLRNFLTSNTNSEVSKQAEQKAPSLFVHMPKTAGTSFRKTLENENIICDYGKDSAVTSQIIKEHIYQNNDLYRLKQEHQKLSSPWLCGHFPLGKYLEFIPIERSIVFTRNPIEQIVSHYNHFVSKLNYQETFDVFLKRPESKNYQSRNIAYLPASLIGCIGLTNRYEDSLRIINHCLSEDLQILQANKNDNQTITPKSLDLEATNIIKKQNQNDFTLFKQASWILEKRLEFLDAEKPWTYTHASINNNNILHGCAYYQNSDRAVSLSIYCNNVKMTTILASGFYHPYTKAQFPRNRYIGFNFIIPQQYRKHGNAFSLYVEETGQKVTQTPLIYPTMRPQP